jgi:hypothetical protein
MIKNNFSILINTCDNFEDCWEPFFRLFKSYWPDYKGKIYLNTEYKEYSYSGLDIVSTKVCEVNNVAKDKRATWSECLMWALQQIGTDLVLYMQEDYFLKGGVKNNLVEDFATLMLGNTDIKCIHLTDQSVITTEKSKFENLHSVALNQRYRVSCQAALWRKSELTGIIRVKESAWEFEEFGSKRSALLGGNYYAVDPGWVKLNEFEIIPYVFTGIIQGRWFEEVIPLFKKHGIEIDYSKRGFVNDAPAKSIQKRIFYRINKIPKILLNNLELRRIRKNKN